MGIKEKENHRYKNSIAARTGEGEYWEKKQRRS
jgi:hypothetical protein